MGRADPETDELLTHHGHDQHFLGRLERVGCREADLALRLYHEPALVRRLLDDAAIAGDSERVAVSLDQGAEPPYVVLTREGKFVTCLGAGMHPGELQVLGWERTCVHVERFDRESQRIGQAVSALRDHRSTLGKDLAYSGARLSREKLEHALLIEPLLHRRLVSLLLDHTHAVSTNLITISQIKQPRAYQKYLRMVWDVLHALGHLFVITSNGGRRSFDHVEHLRRHGIDYFEQVLLPLLQVGYGPLALRVLWSIGRAGKLALPTLKRCLQQETTLGGWTAVAAALTIVGMRHQRLRTEVLGVLNISHLPAALQTAEIERGVETIQAMLKHNDLNGSAGEPARHLIVHVFAGGILDRLHGSPTRSVDERLADPLVLPRLANTPFNYVADPMRLHALLTGAVAFAAQPAEVFYFPAEHLALAPDFSSDVLVRLGRNLASMPVTAPPKPGRNDPCSCGSGKKYKKCCG